MKKLTIPDAIFSVLLIITYGIGFVGSPENNSWFDAYIAFEWVIAFIIGGIISAFLCDAINRVVKEPITIIIFPGLIAANFIPLFWFISRTFVTIRLIRFILYISIGIYFIRSDQKRNLEQSSEH